MSIKRTLAALAVLAIVATGAAACGDDDDDAVTATPTPETEATPTPEGDATPPPAGEAQPAIWPATGVVFATPEEAAEDFVSQALGVPPELGPFQQGDARSGEIEVFSPGEDGGTPVSRSLLLLRQLGPDDGWFVIGAVNENMAVSSPETLAAVPAGELTVEGVGRGFEATIIVTAFLAGDAGAVFDEEITMGGALETPEPYSVTLDLSGAATGEVVTILVRSGVGLETDPGEFSAIPVVIAP